MKIFRMADVEKIEEMLAAGKTVEVEWKDGAIRRCKCRDSQVCKMGWIGIYDRRLHLHRTR